MKGAIKMKLLRSLFKKDQPSEIKAPSGVPQVKSLLLGLPVIKDEKISNYRQTIVSAESHLSMFVGSTNETVGFVAQMAAETENFILSSQGIARVEKQFLMNDYRVGERILEIQYQQFWNNGMSSIYSEHVMRIGEDKFEVFGSESSAKRMRAIRGGQESNLPSKSFTERDNKGEKPIVIGKWKSEDERSGIITYFIFKPGGALIYQNEFTGEEASGVWSQAGNSIHFEVGSFSKYDGTVEGTRMTGTFSNRNGYSGSWSVTYQP
jgi:hypothetical protein